MASNKSTERWSNDNSIVPEGRYKGYLKKDVPVWYKLWIFNECKGTFLHYWFNNTKPSKTLTKYFRHFSDTNDK